MADNAENELFDINETCETDCLPPEVVSVVFDQLDLMYDCTRYPQYTKIYY